MVKDKSTDDQKKGRARTKAFKRLREEQRERWHALLAEEMKAEGITYTPPDPPVVKAAKEALEVLSHVRPDVSLSDVLMFIEAKASVELDKGEIGTRSLGPEIPVEPDEDNAEFEKNDYADAP